MHAPRRFLFLLSLLALAACGHPGAFEPFREVSCFQAAQVSLTDAIAAAEATGGKALDADYREEEEMGCLQNAPGVYDVTLLSGGRINTVSVNARSHAVGPKEEESVMNALLGGGPRFEGSPADMASMLPRMSLTMPQAIAAAEQQGGKAMSAWIERKDGKPGYTVKLVERGRVNVTWIPA